MKKLILLLMLCLSSILGLSQTNFSEDTAILQVTYGLDGNFKKGVTDPTMLDMQAAVRRGEMVLNCSRNKSLSYIPTPYDYTVQSEFIATLLIEAGSRCYEQLSPEYRVIQKCHKEQRFLIANQPQPVWTIQDTSAYINGIFCIYATGYCPSKEEGFTPEKVTAWFAPEYPFPFGPFRLSGLPGLIVRGTYSSVIFTTKEIRNLENEGIEIEMPTKGDTVDSFIEAIHKIRW